MLLEIDYGNTRLKWRLLESKSSKVISRGAVFGFEQLVVELEKIKRLRLLFCRVCSVRSRKESEQLIALLERRFSIPVQVAYSQHELAGVTSGYEDATRLGVDRWLAMIAAYHKVQGACVVIDCGTAITVDCLNADGIHLGGYITPGLPLLSSVLNSCSGLNYHADNVTTIKQEFGVNTQGCMDAGINMMVVGFLKEAFAYAQKELATPFSVVCTGGDSALVALALDDAMVEVDLVFTGLAIACPYKVGG